MRKPQARTEPWPQTEREIDLAFKRADRAVTRAAIAIERAVMAMLDAKPDYVFYDNVVMGLMDELMAPKSESA